MLLSILIPTYNRAQCLRNNCAVLCSAITANGLENKVGIVISNNCSNDETKMVLDETVSSSAIDITVYHQEKNIGSVRNVLFLLNQAKSDYVMFLGDDDYIDENYLVDVCLCISKVDAPTVIIPSNIAISESGEELGYSRDVGFPRKSFPSGFKACLNTSWRGHQMSGLVFLRDGLMENVVDKGICNMYLFIYFIAYLSFKGRVLHLTNYPVEVSRPSQQSKGWSYGDDGLMSEVFDNYRRLDEINFIQRSLLEIKFLDEQYWRYFMYIKLGLPRFFRAIKSIATGKNTSFLTKILFPLIIVFIPFRRIVILMSRGELIQTLRRTVDI